MKRSYFKQKPRKPLKRTPLRKVSLNKAKKKGGREKKKTLAQLKKHLWDNLCKPIIRKIYPNVCYTCGNTGLVGRNWQTGHGKPKGALSLKYQYDLRNLKPQCLHCNKNLGGCSDIFIAKLEQEQDGLIFLSEACVKIDGRWEIKRITPMGSIEAWMFVNEKIEEYTQLLKTL